jgi:signal transduction histidine kinase
MDGLRIVWLSLTLLMVVAVSVFTLVKGKRSPALHAYIWLQALLFIWLSAQILRIYASTHQREWLFVQYEYLSICFIGIAWLIFCLLYIEHPLIKKTRLIVLLFVPPTLSYLALLTNPQHHLFFGPNDIKFSQYAILFDIHAIISYSYLFGGMLLLYQYAKRRPDYTKQQSFALVLAVTVPLAVNIILVTGIFNPGFDMTPVAFSYSLLLFIIATFRYKFLNVVPFALRKIVDNMNEAIVVVDHFNRVVDYNDAMLKTFNDVALVRNNDPIAAFLEGLRRVMRPTPEATRVLEAIGEPADHNVTGELELEDVTRQCFLITIQPFYIGRQFLGRIISFTNISEYKRLLEELTIARERNRMTRDLHDTLGQTMTLIMTLLQVASLTYVTNPAKAREKVDEAIRIAGAGLNDVRHSIGGLGPERLRKEDFACALRELVAEFEASGMKIEIASEGGKAQEHPEYCDTIYRICQEALTNSLRHGQAKNVNIVLRCDAERIKLFILDDGRGCPEIHRGMGLSGMEERVRALQGTIVYGSDGEKGFNIHVEFSIQPREESR